MVGPRQGRSFIDRIHCERLTVQGGSTESLTAVYLWVKGFIFRADSDIRYRRWVIRWPPPLLVEVPFQATGLFSYILAFHVLGLTRRLFVFLLVCSSLGSVTCDGVVAST
jgi:hypothetical protein